MCVIDETDQLKECTPCLKKITLHLEEPWTNIHNFWRATSW